jgi:hypothetical protein
MRLKTELLLQGADAFHLNAAVTTVLCWTNMPAANRIPAVPHNIEHWRARQNLNF